MGLLDKLFGKTVEIEINGKTHLINTKAHFHLIKALELFKENLIDKSVQEINLSIKILSKNQNLYFYKGYFLEELSKYDEAILAYQNSIQINQNQPWVLFRLGYCYQMLKNNVRALELYTECINNFEEYNDPLINCTIKLEQVYNNRAPVQALLNDSNKCVADASKAIELNPNYSNPYLIRGLEYLKFNIHDLALKDLETAVKLGSRQAKDVIDEYFPNSAQPTQTIDNLVEQILFDVKKEDLIGVRPRMFDLFSKIKANPILLDQTRFPDKLGKAFALMLNNRLSKDDDVNEAIACLAYFLVSKAIRKNPSSNLYLDRLLIIEFSREQFNYSIQSALDVNEGGSINFFSAVGQMGGTRARDGIFKMEIADLYTNPVLYQQVDIFRNKKEKFDNMIIENFFYNKTLSELIAEGKANHDKAYKFFYNKIIINQDVEV